MSATPQSVVDSASSLIQAAQGGFELGNSSDAFQAYTNALNLAGTFAGQGPWGVGLNAAATANNTLSAYNAFRNGALQPSDILQITGSALALAIAAAAIAGAPVTLSALALAGTIGIVAGPGPLRDSFNEYATRLGQMMTGGSLGTVEANLPAIASNIGGEGSGDVLVVRQYDSGTSEFTTLEIINKDGVSYGEIGRLSGNDNFLGWADPIKVRVQGSLENPTLIEFPELGEIEIHASATLVSSSVVNLTEAQTSNWIGYALSAASNSFGNSIDFARNGFEAMGLTYDQYGTFFNSSSLTSQALGIYDWFNHDVEWYQQYYDPDMEADWRLSQLHTIENKVGEAEGHDELIDRVMSGVASPIVIDLDGNGIQTRGLMTSTIQFDVTGDGAKERTGWLSSGDGFLARDVDQNGRIEGVAEMFGGMNRGDGFAELGALDSNADGQVDAADADYSKLLVWQDINQNGRTDDGELRSLADAGVTQLSVSYTSTETFDHGNLIGEVSTAIVGGAERAMADVYFRYSSSPEPTDSFAGHSTLDLRKSGASVRPTSEASQLDRTASSLISAMATFAPGGPAGNEIGVSGPVDFLDRIAAPYSGFRAA